MNTSPFELYNQDVDEVIMTINFYIALGAEQRQQGAIQKTNKTQTAKSKQERIRVNDATATGGWF